MFLTDLLEERDIRRQQAEEHIVKKNDRPTLAATDAPRHEYHDTSGVTLHRVVSGNLAGQWVTYQQVATLKTPSGVLHARTDYFHGALPTNAVFTIQEIA